MKKTPLFKETDMDQDDVIKEATRMMGRHGWGAAKPDNFLTKLDQILTEYDELATFKKNITREVLK